ncbi:putative transmembrane protein [Gregarina niphandrodes]|uniref:Transmembrane protein n=1 Tax=Gregarina niphandrodes TaxID=110365 RepID=A0A023BC15_GRENI|nr:putative transmembrane protein [Gregarina niphandrodes]EZG81698.1 putative transmembrane protein [Gregarina niphandrodes]|eukprot:XP_011134204.1 putative transmembrane protein [Gregarina niphandrodes]
MIPSQSVRGSRRFTGYPAANMLQWAVLVATIVFILGSLTHCASLFGRGAFGTLVWTEGTAGTEAVAAASLQQMASAAAPVAQSPSATPAAASPPQAPSAATASQGAAPSPQAAAAALQAAAVAPQTGAAAPQAGVASPQTGAAAPQTQTAAAAAAAPAAQAAAPSQATTNQSAPKAAQAASPSETAATEAATTSADSELTGGPEDMKPLPDKAYAMLEFNMISSRLLFDCTKPQESVNVEHCKTVKKLFENHPVYLDNTKRLIGSTLFDSAATVAGLSVGYQRWLSNRLPNIVEKVLSDKAPTKNVVVTKTPSPTVWIMAVACALWTLGAILVAAEWIISRETTPRVAGPTNEEFNDIEADEEISLLLPPPTSS